MKSYTQGVLRAYHWVLLFRASCLLALSVSVALLLDYTRASPSFCGVDSGCGAVRQSGLGYIPLGFGELPVPVVGVLAFGFLFAGTLLRSSDLAARFVSPLAYAGSVVALVFIGLQVWLGHYCYLCMIADLSALVIGASAFVLRGSGWQQGLGDESSRTTLMDPSELMSEGQRVKGVWRDDSQVYDAPNPLVRSVPPEPLRLRRRTWWLLCALAVAAPVGFPLLVQRGEVPSVIRALYRDGEITVVEFFDFQCPHCQDLSPRLKRLTEQNPRLALRFGYTPLPGHPQAREAARIAICAGEQDKEKQVAGRFFRASEFSSEYLRSLAASVVDDPAALTNCLQSDRPDQRIEEDTQALKAAGFVGLPTTYVGNIRILGAQDDLVYRDAFRRVLEGSDEKGLSPWVYWAAVLLVAIALVLAGRVAPSDRRSIPS